MTIWTIGCDRLGSEWLIGCGYISWSLLVYRTCHLVEFIGETLSCSVSFWSQIAESTWSLLVVAIWRWRLIESTLSWLVIIKLTLVVVYMKNVFIEFNEQSILGTWWSCHIFFLLLPNRNNWRLIQEYKNKYIKGNCKMQNVVCVHPIDFW